MSYVMHRNPARPLIQDRYESFTHNVRELREMIRVLCAVYDDTGHESLLSLIRRFELYERQEVAFEDMWQQDEINEVLDHPGQYPSCVVTWIKYYRDKEMEL